MSRSERRHHNARLLAKYREVAKKAAGPRHGWAARNATYDQYVERYARQLVSYHHSCSWCRHPDGGYNRREACKEKRWLLESE